MHFREAFLLGQSRDSYMATQVSPRVEGGSGHSSSSESNSSTEESSIYTSCSSDDSDDDETEKTQGTSERLFHLIPLMGEVNLPKLQKKVQNMIVLLQQCKKYCTIFMDVLEKLKEDVILHTSTGPRVREVFRAREKV